MHAFQLMQSALTTELREWDSFQLMVWDTGFGDMDILVAKINTINATMHGQKHPFYTAAEYLYIHLQVYDDCMVIIKVDWQVPVNVLAHFNTMV